MIWAFDLARSVLVVFGFVSSFGFRLLSCSVVLIVRSFCCWPLGCSLNHSVIMPGTLRLFICSVVQVLDRLLFGCLAHWWPFSGLFSLVLLLESFSC